MNFLRKKVSHKDAYSDTCENHPAEKVLFCPECDDIYCLHCTLTGHHDMPHIFKPINSVAETFEKSEEFENYMKKISTLKDESDLSSRTIEENIILANKYKDEADKKIKQKGEELIKMIQDHVQKCFQENKMKHDNCVSRLTACTNQVCELKAQIEQIENEIDRKRKKPEKSSMFITVQKSKHNIIRIDEERKQIHENTYVTSYEFKTKKQIFGDMKNVDAFGVFVEMSSKLEKLSHSRPKSEPCLSGSDELPIFQEKEKSEEGYLKPRKAESNLSLEVTQPYVIDIGDEVRQERLRKLSETKRQAMERNNSWSYFGHQYPETRTQKSETYKMLCTYTAEEEDQLSFNGGDIVNVLNRKEGDEWLMVELNGRSGYVPANYVEKYVIKNPPKIAPKPSIEAIRQAQERNKSLSNFAEQSSDRQMPKSEMSPKSDTKSDPCLSGSFALPIFQEKEEFEKGNVKPHIAESNLSLNETQPYRKNEESYTVSNRGDQETYIVLYQYKAKTDDELSINEGDIVNVVERCVDEEWLLAELNGKSGYVPANYVDKIV